MRSTMRSPVIWRRVCFGPSALCRPVSPLNFFPDCSSMWNSSFQFTFYAIRPVVGNHSILTFLCLRLFLAMAAIGSLVFCTDCGNLLDGGAGKQNAILTCRVCGAQCKGSMPFFSYCILLVPHGLTKTSRHIIQSHCNALQTYCIPIIFARKEIGGANRYRRRHADSHHHQRDMREVRKGGGPILHPAAP